MSASQTMMPMRLLIATEANEGLGHVASWKALVQTMLRADHSVSFACPQAALAQSIFQAHSGLTIEPTLWPGMRATSSPSVAIPTNSWEDILFSLGYGAPKAVKACLEFWVQLLQRMQPVCVVADYAPLAMVAAKALGIMLVEAGAGYCVPPQPISPNTPVWLPAFLRRLAAQPGGASATATAGFVHTAARRGQQITQAINQALSSLGLAYQLPQFASLYALAKHRCVSSQPALDTYAPYADRSSIQYLGQQALASMGQPLLIVAPAWCAHAPHTLRVLCYLKANTPDLSSYLKALDKIPPTVRTLVASSTIDFATALPMANIFVTNGGIHSLGIALQQGCHCILVPSQAEQAATALHLAQHPQVSVCMDAQSMQLSIRTIIKQSQVKSHSARNVPIGISAEAALLQTIQIALARKTTMTDHLQEVLVCK